VSREDTLADQLKVDYRKAELTPRERAMLDYVDKLTRSPWSMRESDVQSLRTVGFDDLAILHIVQLAAFFNYLNRVADGLGIELDPDVWERVEQHGAIPWEEESGSRRPSSAMAPAGGVSGG
jgi:uncharacterized peroxidase-related enzyme